MVTVAKAYMKMVIRQPANSKQCVVEGCMNPELTVAHFLVVTGHVLLDMHLSTLIQWILQRLQANLMPSKIQPTTAQSRRSGFDFLLANSLRSLSLRPEICYTIAFFPGFLCRQCVYGILILFEISIRQRDQRSLRGHIFCHHVIFIAR